MHWTLETPTEPGDYLVCTHTLLFGAVLVVREGDGLVAFAALFEAGGMKWGSLDEIVNCYRVPLRWCKIDPPPSIAELQANRQG